MRKTYSIWIAGLCFSAVIPTAVAMMWPTISMATGYWIIGVATVVGLIALIVAAWPTRLPPSQLSGDNIRTIDQSIKADNNRGTITQTNQNIINQVQKPQVNWGQKRTTPKDSSYLIECDLEVVTPHPIGELWFEVHGKNVRDFNLYMRRTGMQQSGHSGCRENYCFTSIYNAFGRYKLNAIADTPDIEIKYGFK